MVLQGQLKFIEIWELRRSSKAWKTQAFQAKKVAGNHWGGPSQMALVVKNTAANAGDIRDAGMTPGSGRSPAGGHGNPLQYSCVEDPMHRGAWRAIVQWVEKSRTRLKRLSTHALRRWALQMRGRWESTWQVQRPVQTPVSLWWEHSAARPTGRVNLHHTSDALLRPHPRQTWPMHHSTEPSVISEPLSTLCSKKHQ